MSSQVKIYCYCCHKPLAISKETAVKNGGGKVRCSNCGEYVSVKEVRNETR